MGTGIMIGFVNTTNLVVTPTFVILQFWPQFLEMRRSGAEPGTLSLLSLGLQATAMTSVAIRWLLRLGSPVWAPKPAPVWLYYTWGMYSFNYFLYAIGCAVLLAAYLFTSKKDGMHGGAGERAPLLP
jgi:hypothetical protein